MAATIHGPGGEVDVTDRVSRLLGHVIVDQIPTGEAAGGGLTNSELRSAPVPVGGSVLDAIAASVDSLEPQTDALEALVQAVRDRLPGALDGDGGLKTHVQNLAELATQATLQQVLTSVDGLEALLTDIRTELRRRSVKKIATGLKTAVGANLYTTVFQLTRPVPITILGYNADFRALTNQRYRMRLCINTDTDAGVRHGEELTTDQNSWTDICFDVVANDLIMVQLLHGDTLNQYDIRGTLAYAEAGT